jgi:hypothetical protein
VGSHPSNQVQRYPKEWAEALRKMMTFEAEVKNIFLKNFFFFLFFKALVAWPWTSYNWKREGEVGSFRNCRALGILGGKYFERNK